MPDNRPHVLIPINEWVDLYDLTGIPVGQPLLIENTGACEVYLTVHASQPEPDHNSYNIIKRRDNAVLGNTLGDSGAWAFCNASAGLLSVSTTDSDGFIRTSRVTLADADGNPIDSLGGAISVHDAHVHNQPVNELFHRHTGISTTVSVTGSKQDRSLEVASVAGFAVGDNVQIGNSVIESTFPEIMGITGEIITFDRPLDFSHDAGATVAAVTFDMAVNGSTTPVAFRLEADPLQLWHILSIILTMTHSSAADDSSFGNLPALSNGCVLRGYSAAVDQYVTLTVWKTNGDIKGDMSDVSYTDKAGGGLHGVNGNGALYERTGAVPRLDGDLGDYMELLIQDDLSSLETFKLKGQGHVEVMRG